MVIEKLDLQVFPVDFMQLAKIRLATIFIPQAPVAVVSCNLSQKESDLLIL